jgi:hypothetical protein
MSCHPNAAALGLPDAWDWREAANPHIRSMSGVA